MILDRFKLDGKAAIVTGAGQGIGKALALGLAEAGANIAAVDIVQERLDGLCGEIEAIGRKALPLVCDVTDVAATREMVGQVRQDLGSVDILANNAGINLRDASVDYAPEMWDKMMAVDLRGAFFMAQAAGRVMIEQGKGKIINTCSILSRIGRPTITAYTAAKHGLLGVTRALAVEWGPHGINVNGIAPGYFVTEMTQVLKDDPKFDAWVLDRVPLKRWGEVSDLRGAVVYLASDASDYVTGQLIYVDGGWTAG